MPPTDRCAIPPPVGARVHIIGKRKKTIGFGTIVRRDNANDDMTWGHKMRPDWIVTVDIDGMGPRRFRNNVGDSTAARKLGRVHFVELPTDRCANPYCGKTVTTSCDNCSAKLCAECALSADGGNAVACPPCARGEWEEWGVADE